MMSTLTGASVGVVAERRRVGPGVDTVEVMDVGADVWIAGCLLSGVSEEVLGKANNSTTI